jgi:hypothetical protein
MKVEARVTALPGEPPDGGVSKLLTRQRYLVNSVLCLCCFAQEASWRKSNQSGTSGTFGEGQPPPGNTEVKGDSPCAATSARTLRTLKGLRWRPIVRAVGDGEELPKTLRG